MFIANYVTEDNKGVARALRTSILVLPIMIQMQNSEDASFQEFQQAMMGHGVALRSGLGITEDSNDSFLDDFFENIETISEFTKEKLASELTFENTVIPALRKTFKESEVSLTLVEKKAILFDMAKLILKDNEFKDDERKLLEYVAKEFRADKETVDELLSLAKKFQSLFKQCEEIINE